VIGTGGWSRFIPPIITKASNSDITAFKQELFEAARHDGVHIAACGLYVDPVITIVPV
jgi:hypothetical protein